jgi:hypothetical protein
MLSHTMRISLVADFEEIEMTHIQVFKVKHFRPITKYLPLCLLIQSSAQQILHIR